MGLLLGGHVKAASIFGGGGDTVDLQAISTVDEEDEPSNANARITVHTSTSRIGEAWYDFLDTETKKNDVVIPNVNINLYEMKWEALSGDAPDITSVAQSTWQSLASGDFFVHWSETDTGNVAGSVTVSIGLIGTSSAIDSAVWDGDADVAAE